MDRTQCDTICEDGSRCVLASDHIEIAEKYGLRWEHFSEKQRETGRVRGQDRSRPYHLEAGKPMDASFVSSWKSKLVPVNLKFDDGDIVGERCIGWIRPEDIWRVIPE